RDHLDRRVGTEDDLQTLGEHLMVVDHDDADGRVGAHDFRDEMYTDRRGRVPIDGTVPGGAPGAIACLGATRSAAGSWTRRPYRQAEPGHACSASRTVFLAFRTPGVGGPRAFDRRRPPALDGA